MTSFRSMKVALISIAILSIAMAVKLTIPVVSHFIFTEAPNIWTFLLTCFTPPYLYLLLNFIILTILVTTKFHNEYHHSPPETPQTPLLPTEPEIYAAAYDGTPVPFQISAPEPLNISIALETDYNSVVSEIYAYEVKTDETTVTEGNDSVAYISDENTPVKTTVVSATEEVCVSSLQRKDSSDFAFNDENEKPPVSARFSHRKAVRAGPEGGKVLGVTKPKRQDTLETTWRTITEGRAMPLTRHLKKTETFETQPRRNGTPLADLNGGGGGGSHVMKKSETFRGRDKSLSPAGSGGKLRKEPSLSQDELNRRVEAFINKFNAEMRLQRQESLRQYREMTNGRVH